MTDIAWIAGGQLHRRRDDGAPAVVHSAFLDRVRDADARAAERNAWKRSGEGPDALMQRARATATTEPAFSAVCPGQPLRYALDTGAVGGLFEVQPDGTELRLFHTERFRFRSVAPGPEGGLLASVASGLRAHLATLRPDGTALRELTEGDAVDLHPRLTPDGRAVVYQSAGLSRDAQLAGATAPFEVLSLDLRTGDITTLAAEPDRDLLQPRVAPDGAKLYLRTPPRPRAPGLGQQLLALLTWPLHVLAGLLTLVGWLGRLSNLPGSAAAGGPNADDARLRQLLLQGALLPPTTPDAPPPPVPSNAWELVRVRGGQPPEVLARRVIAWDLADDGALLLTDGQAITLQHPDGRREELARSANVHAVAFL